MLLALLALDAVLRKLFLKTFQRRDTIFNSSQFSHCKLSHQQNFIFSTFAKRLFSANSNDKKMSSRDKNCSDSEGLQYILCEAAEKKESVDKTTILSFKDGDTQYCHEIRNKSVQIFTTPGTHNHGSSKVKLKNIVDYIWEVKNYTGHLIAVHIDKKHIAYVINVNNKVSRMEGMVRVINTSKGLRALIKGLSGEVLDLQFAHIEKEHILASIDANSLYVHKIKLRDDSLLCHLILKIEDPLINYSPKYDKISWCPFIETPGDDDEDSKLIVWARGSLFQCFNINIIVADQGIGTFQANEIKSGYIKHYDDAKTITWVALSPDGSTLGVGCTDGIICFYQVYIHEKDPRCLHEWKPYENKPISSFFFLDNLTKNNSDTYWKFAITGAENNTEFKVWDCGTWSCLQTISFNSNVNKPLHLIAEMDRTSSYLVVSCLETRSCYVMQIINISSSSSLAMKEDSVDTDASISSAASDNVELFTKPLVFIKSISEFPLSSGILSFSIVDAAVRRYKCSNDNYMCEELDDYDEESSSIFCVVVHMYVVQAKSMQECHILYQPTLTDTADVKSTISSSNTSIENQNKTKKNISPNLSDSNEPTADHHDVNISDKRRGDEEHTILEMNKAPGVIASKHNDQSKNPSPNASLLNKSYSQLNLMTPEAFTSSTNNESKTPENVSTEVLNTILMLAGVTSQNKVSAKSESINLLSLVNNKIIENKEQQISKFKHYNIETQKKFIAIDRNSSRSNVENLASGGSSPSREVQEIMSLQEYDTNAYSAHELLEQNNEIVQESNTSTKDEIKLSATDTSKSNTKSSQNKHSAELQNAANLISQAVNTCSLSSLNKSNLPPTLASSSNNNGNNVPSVGSNIICDFSDVNGKINELIELVKMQSLQINSLQNEVSELKKSNGSFKQKNLTELGYKLEMQLSKLMEKYLIRYETEHNRKLSSFLSGKDGQNRELRDSIMQILNQFVLNQFGDMISKVIAVEIQRHVMPMLAVKIDNMQQQILLNVAQKLSTFDVMIKENIAQVCKSKAVIDSFGKSVLFGVQGSLQTAFIESMSSTLVPAYEKSSQHMFKQLHEAFSVGIKEFMDQFDNYLQQLQPMQNSTEEILTKFSGFHQHFDAILSRHLNGAQDMMLETRRDIKGLELLLSRQIQETIRAEVRKSFENQVAVIRSQANTPAPIYGLKDTIRHLLLQGQTNKAFHQALLANDLNLVEYTLKNADHNAVFTPDCCLEQKVLLSLIQQISADMSDHNELKQNYLNEALLAINTSDPITREHAPKVLQELYRNCQMFLINYPKSSQCSNVRMLMKAVQAIKDQI